MPKIKKTLSPGRLEADRLLETLAAGAASKAALESALAAELAVIEERYAVKLAIAADYLKARAAELKAHLKAAHDELFGLSEDISVELPHGSVAYSKTERVKIPQGVTGDYVWELGEEYRGAVKIVKTLDREALEEWTDEKLLAAGLKRAPLRAWTWTVKE